MPANAACDGPPSDRFRPGVSDDPCQFPLERPVNPRRYRHYRHSLVLILAHEDGVGMKDSDVLREIAQDLLLARGSELQETELLVDHLARVLAHLIEKGVLSLGESTEIWREVRQCGPGPRDREPGGIEGEASRRPQEVAR